MIQKALREKCHRRTIGAPFSLIYRAGFWELCNATHTHTHTLSLSLSQAHTHTHIRTETHTHVHTHAHIRTYIYAYIITVSQRLLIWWRTSWFRKRSARNVTGVPFLRLPTDWIPFSITTRCVCPCICLGGCGCLRVRMHMCAYIETYRYAYMCIYRNIQI